MSRVLAYFVGGSHDLEKRWVDEKRQVWDLPEYMNDPHPVRWAAGEQVTEAVYNVERYVRICRLRGQRDAYVYEYRPNE